MKTRRELHLCLNELDNMDLTLVQSAGISMVTPKTCSVAPYHNNMDDYFIWPKLIYTLNLVNTDNQRIYHILYILLFDPSINGLYEINYIPLSYRDTSTRKINFGGIFGEQTCSNQVLSSVRCSSPVSSSVSTSVLKQFDPFFNFMVKPWPWRWAWLWLEERSQIYSWFLKGILASMFLRQCFGHLTWFSANWTFDHS